MYWYVADENETYDAPNDGGGVPLYVDGVVPIGARWNLARLAVGMMESEVAAALVPILLVAVTVKV